MRLGGELTFTATEWKDGPCLHIAGDLLVSWGHVLVQGWANVCLDGWFGTGALSEKIWDDFSQKQPSCMMASVGGELGSEFRVLVWCLN